MHTFDKGIDPISESDCPQMLLATPHKECVDTSSVDQEPWLSWLLALRHRPPRNFERKQRRDSGGRRFQRPCRPTAAALASACARASSAAL